MLQRFEVLAKSVFVQCFSHVQSFLVNILPGIAFYMTIVFPHSIANLKESLLPGSEDDNKIIVQTIDKFNPNLLTGHSSNDQLLLLEPGLIISPLITPIHLKMDKLGVL